MNKIYTDFLPPDEEANVHGFWVPSPEEIEEAVKPFRELRIEHGEIGKGSDYQMLQEVAAWVADHWQEYDDISDRGFIELVHRRFGRNRCSGESVLNYRRGARRGTLAFREASGRYRWR